MAPGVQGIPGTPTTGEQFGSIVATGDFNGDGFTDLAAASPFTPLGGTLNVGSLVVVYGSATGLSAQVIPPFDFQPEVESRLFLGASLAAGDFNGNGFDDLAVGVPGFAESRGAVIVFPGSADGLLSGPGIEITLTQNSVAT